MNRRETTHSKSQYYMLYFLFQVPCSPHFSPNVPFFVKLEKCEYDHLGPILTNLEPILPSKSTNLSQMVAEKKLTPLLGSELHFGGNEPKNTHFWPLFGHIWSHILNMDQHSGFAGGGFETGCKIF